MGQVVEVNNAWLSEEKINLLRQTYAQDLGDKQFELFCHIAQKMDLDPINKEIYGMVLAKKLVIVVGIDGFRKTAHKTGDYMGMDKTDIVRDDETNKIISASCTVYKRVHGEKCAFHAEVIFSEYNKGQGNWVKMPQTMISKVAESHALRKAFPALSNVYTPEELDKQGADFESDRAKTLTDRFVGEPEVKAKKYMDEVELEPEDIEIEVKEEIKEPKKVKPEEVKNGKQSNVSGPIRKTARTKKPRQRQQRS